VQNLKFVSSAVPKILGGGGSHNSKVGHVTHAALPCDLILYFLISTSWSPLSFKFQVDWTSCFGDIAVVRFWHFGWKMPIWTYFSRFWEF